MTVSDSRENLVDKPEAPQPMMVNRNCSLTPQTEKPLTPLEKRFLLFVERGDCASVRRHIEENKNNPEFNLNCVDPLNRSALITAIENENFELVNALVDSGIEVKDSLLHAIKEEYVEAVEILLEYEEKNHKPGTPYSWEAVDRAQCTFTADITPLMLAAHMNNYEIIKILLDRGATLPTPHDVRCGCDDCIESSEKDSLRYSQARINAYRALSSPSLIALSSRDPLLTAFELSWELRRLSKVENEFREDYIEMRDQVQTFATSLLDHARTSAELDTILNHDPDSDSSELGKRCSLARLKLAIEYKQKTFVSHPSVQQLLSKMWYDGLPGFRRKNMLLKLIDVGKMGAAFPVNSALCLLAPNSDTAKLMSKPFVKFINHSASYSFFLLLLGAVSQRVEHLAIEIFGTPWMQTILAEWKRKERGSFPGIVESGVVIYVISLISWEIRALWNGGLLEYIKDLWNMVDILCNTFFTTWLVLRGTSIFITWREHWRGWDPYYPREEWDPFDPMLLSEGMFAAGMILSFLKLVHIFSVNPHLGPLQISLGRMLLDIIKFFFIYMLVLFAFGCGMNKLMWYYADLERRKCYLPTGEADFENEEMACTIWRRFSNLFETSQSLFWASFGLVDLMAFELEGMKSFTRFWALLMFGSYSVINVIVLLNLLIAMMSNSYAAIVERSDVEWKFARSKLWLSYFEDGEIMPPPFNLVPGVELLQKICGKEKKCSGSVRVRNREAAQERHDTVARLLVRRFVVAEQRKRDDFGITEDDIMEVRQDISTLKYEIVDILKNNGMKTPNLESGGGGLAGKKGKVMERRLMQDFKIGCVEGIVSEVLTTEKESKEIFGKIAKAIGKRRSTQRGTKNAPQKKDWNAVAERQKSVRNPIGSVSELERRRSSQQSLRKYIIDNEKSDVAHIDSSKLVEYNPKLKDVTPAARVAYAKFKTRKIKKEFKEHETVPEAGEDEVFDQKTAARPRPTASAGFNALVKQSVSSNKDVVVQIEPEVAKAQAAPRGQGAEAPGKAPAAQTKPAASQPAAASPPAPTPGSSGTPPSSAPPPSSGTTAPPPEKRASQSGPKTTETAAKSETKTDEKRASKKEVKADEKRASKKEVKPQTDAPKPKTQYSSDLEPGRGKSKVTGRMVQGWI